MNNQNVCIFAPFVWVPCTDTLVSWTLGQKPGNDWDADAWKIEQNGRIVCSNDDQELGSSKNPTIQTCCSLDLTQDYRLTCTSVEIFGFDYVSSSDPDKRFDGFLMIGSDKYCDSFENEEIVTIHGQGNRVK